MHDQQIAVPDNTAVRTALWRALHVEVDAPPHVFEDTVGLKGSDACPTLLRREDRWAASAP